MRARDVRTDEDVVAALLWALLPVLFVLGLAGALVLVIGSLLGFL